MPLSAESEGRPVRGRPHLTQSGKLLLVILAGVALGGFFGNGPGREWSHELGIFSPAYRAQLAGGAGDLRKEFLSDLFLRGVPVLLILLGGRFRNTIYRVMLFWYSFSVSVFWTACLLYAGGRGIVFFLAALCPQWLIYGLIMGILGTSMISNWYLLSRKLLILASLLVLGAASEAALHPMIVRWLLPWFAGT